MFRGRQMKCVLPANNLLATLHILFHTKALLWRGKLATPLVARTYQSLPGFLVDTSFGVWQHDQCRSDDRKTCIQTKSPDLLH